MTHHIRAAARLRPCLACLQRISLYLHFHSSPCRALCGRLGLPVPHESLKWSLQCGRVRVCGCVYCRCRHSSAHQPGMPRFLSLTILKYLQQRSRTCQKAPEVPIPNYMPEGSDAELILLHFQGRGFSKSKG